jgi:hypothetical protein
MTNYTIQSKRSAGRIKPLRITLSTRAIKRALANLPIGHLRSAVEEETGK